MLSDKVVVARRWQHELGGRQGGGLLLRAILAALAGGPFGGWNDSLRLVPVEALEAARKQTVNFGIGITPNRWDIARQRPTARRHLHSIANNRVRLRMTAIDNDPLIRDADAAGILGCSKATFWRRVADGTIPRPVKIGGMSRWPQSEITAVIEQAKQRRAH